MYTDSRESPLAFDPRRSIDARENLVGVAERFSEWMRHQALPLWSSAGFCEEDGGFYEALDGDGAPLKDADRRVRVQFRQIYVYSRASLMGWCADGLDRASSAFSYVLRHAWGPDGEPGWINRLDAAGRPRSLERDAYDQAFSLLALGWYHQASDDNRARIMIEWTQAFIDEYLSTPSGGWAETRANTARIRRQNPHMHAFEAYLALYEIFREPVWLHHANRMLSLFETRFYDGDVGRVREYFTPKLTPIDAARQREEPGHGAEWAWLLSEHRRLSGDGSSARSRALLQRSKQAGASADAPFLVDELNGFGVATKMTRRLWPQTELLRASVAAVRDDQDMHASENACAIADALMREYLSVPATGAWIDKFDDCGQPIAGPAPASTLYHLFGAASALSELINSQPYTNARRCRRIRSLISSDAGRA